jgi:hypothetical protein
MEALVDADLRPVGWNGGATGWRDLIVWRGRRGRERAQMTSRAAGGQPASAPTSWSSTALPDGSSTKV